MAFASTFIFSWLSIWVVIRVASGSFLGLLKFPWREWVGTGDPVMVLQTPVFYVPSPLLRAVEVGLVEPLHIWILLERGTVEPVELTIRLHFGHLAGPYAK